MKIYKKILIILLATCLLLGTGCVNLENEEKQHCKEVIRCLSEDDTEGLKNMFCVETQNSKDLDEQIEAGMEFFDGKVLSYNEPICSGGESVTNGKIVEHDYGGDIMKIKTDTGKIYSLMVYEYLVNEDNPDIVGISEIDIYDEDGNVYEVGEFID